MKTNGEMRKSGETDLETLLWRLDNKQADEDIRNTVVRLEKQVGLWRD